MLYRNIVLPLIFSAILLSSIVSFPPAYSIPIDEIIKLLASDAAAGDEFGTSVSISGDTAIIGAPFDDGRSGSAYVFEKAGGTWTQVAKLTASIAEFDARFGTSVSISGDTAIVSAPFDDAGGEFVAGAVYVFVKPVGGWVDSSQADARLTASIAEFNAQFGTSVSISGDTAIVGAVREESRSGAAYVFVKPGGGWSGNLNQNAKLKASDKAGDDQFGTSVSISGDTAIVGAPFNDDVPLNSGSAYVFVKPGGGWSGNLNQNAKLTASDAAGNIVSGDEFGISVSISGDTAIVGAHRADPPSGLDTGSAYVFVKPGGGWSGNLNEVAKLTASGAASFDEFGISVSISGDTAIVSADQEDNRRGAAYVFVKPGGGWSGNLNEDARLTASDVAAFDEFGNSVSISGDTAIVGANRNGDEGFKTGSAYIFAQDFDGDGEPDSTDPSPKDPCIPNSSSPACDSDMDGTPDGLDGCPNDPNKTTPGTTGCGNPEPPKAMPVGGEMIPLDTTMVLVAGTQTIASWMIPVIVSAIGIGIVIARKL